MMIREGVVSEADHKKYIDSLEDAGKKADWVEFQDLAPASYRRAVLGDDEKTEKQDKEEEKN